MFFNEAYRSLNGTVTVLFRSLMEVGLFEAADRGTSFPTRIIDNFVSVVMIVEVKWLAHKERNIENNLQRFTSNVEYSFLLTKQHSNASTSNIFNIICLSSTCLLHGFQSRRSVYACALCFVLDA